jgi:hypothetical protein
MARNVYFSQAVGSEQDLYEDLVIESLKIYGQDVYYIPRTIVNKDNIMGEDIASKFDDAYMIEAYIENPEGFEGSGDLYSKFGLEIRDDANFIISRRQWNRLVGVWNNAIEVTKPQSGDLIYLPMSNSMFEIMMVEDEQPFYQLSNLPVYKLQCSLFEYNNESLDTGVDAIDNLLVSVAYQVALDLTDTGANHFILGETVTQTIVEANGDVPAIEIYGEVQTVTKTSDTVASISVSNIGVKNSEIARDFSVSLTKPLVGSTTGNICYITKVYNVADNDPNNVFASDSLAKNTAFEFEGDSILDFSESNPFGDPSETY